MDDYFPRWLLALIGTLLGGGMLGLCSAVILYDLKRNELAERIGDGSTVLILASAGLCTLSGLFYLWRWVLS